MNTVTQTRNSESINWKQLTSLAALNAAIVISWIAYHNYQPQLLVKFNFTDLAYFLIIAQGIILIIIPPIAGIIGDYMIKKNSNYFIVFTIGISITAMVFMAVAFTISKGELLSLRGALPFMIVVWLISMNIFHSPANSMLDLFAPAQQLPVAMAVITMITELLMALEPVVIYIVDYIGATNTFILGGVMLIVSGYFFKKTVKDAPLKRTAEDEASANKNNFLVVAVVGILIGVAGAIIKNLLPDLLTAKFQNSFLEFKDFDLEKGNPYVSIILITTALGSLPFSFFVTNFGVSKSLKLGFLLTFACLCFVYISPDPVTCLIGSLLLGASFSIISVSAFPYALYNLSKKSVTYGTGIFFGSLEIASSILNIYQAQ